MKQCTSCKQFFPATTEFFHTNNQQASGLHPRCKTCRAKERSARYEINGEAERAQMREYAKEHSKEAVNRVANWREENPESRKEFRERHKDRLRQIDREYVKNHLDAFAVRNRNRRAAVRNSEGTHTLEDIHQLYKEQNGNCAYCGVSLGNKYHVDHIVPIARGGSNYPSNLALACADCNLSKGSKLLEEWIS